MSTPAYSPVEPSERQENPKKQPNVVQRYARMVYNPLGFKKVYNFIFWFIFAGALFGFCWWNIRSIDVKGHWIKDAPPGDDYYFRLPRYSLGMQIHLGTILPAGILVFFQFFPLLRYKALIVHRINGYVITTLLFISNAGALMIADRSFGGLYDTQVFVGILAIFTTVSAIMGVVNIRLKQIDQHRKWMIRCWVYAGSIITLRFVQITAALITSQLGGFFIQMNCGSIAYMGGNASSYPACAFGGDEAYTAVMVDFETERGVEEVAASLQMVFGQAGLIALVIHAVLVEVYFHLTPKESERLRKVSYERQLERGHKHPGSSGLTSDRLGDADWWTPPVAAEK